MSFHFPESGLYTQALQPLSQLAQEPKTPSEHSFMSLWQNFPLFPSLLAQLWSLFVAGQSLQASDLCSTSQLGPAATRAN